MKYPPSEYLELVTGKDGNDYALRFYGEDEGAAVIKGPLRHGAGLVKVPDVHREPAKDAAEARLKLDLWRRRNL